MKSNQITLPEATTGLDRILTAGHTPVYVAEDGKLLGHLVINDPIRQEAPEVVKKLQSRKIRVILLSGDRQAAAEVVAAKLGITDVIGDVLPEKKFETVKSLQSSGKIAMVGDARILSRS